MGKDRIIDIDFLFNIGFFSFLIKNYYSSNSRIVVMFLIDQRGDSHLRELHRLTNRSHRWLNCTNWASEPTHLTNRE